MKNAVIAGHCTFLGRRRPDCTFLLVVVNQTAVFYLFNGQRSLALSTSIFTALFIMPLQHACYSKFNRGASVSNSIAINVKVNFLLKDVNQWGRVIYQRKKNRTLGFIAMVRLKKTNSVFWVTASKTASKTEGKTEGLL